jgi:hypothetical protein
LIDQLENMRDALPKHNGEYEAGENNNRTDNQGQKGTATCAIRTVTSSPAGNSAKYQQEHGIPMQRLCLCILLSALLAWFGHAF